MGSGALERMAAWATSLRLEDVPLRVREQARNQILSILGATHAGYASDLGPRVARALSGVRGTARAVPAPKGVRPVDAAVLMSAWSMILDFDDSMLGGHTGHSSVLVPIAYARGRTGADVLLAQIAANELAARVNTAVALGSARGQMATHVHLVGAAAARARLEGLDADDYAQAVGFALTYPSKALYTGFLGSDAKVLSAAWPVRMGLEAVDAVKAGLRGNPNVLDEFVARFADVPVRSFLDGLGERWHTETNSFKVHPGCAYIDAVIDATLALVHRYDVAADDVASVDVGASVFTVGMDARSAPFVDGERSLVSTLSFSTPYNVAWAIIDRDLRPEHLTRPRIADERVWALAAKVRLHHDEGLTIEALTSDAPMGAALKVAGRDALRYVAKMVPRGSARTAPRTAATGAKVARAVLDAAKGGMPDLSKARKAVGAKVEIRTTDGRRFSDEVHIPLGAAGSGDWKALRGLMRSKFYACASPGVGDARAQTAADAIEELERLDADELWTMIEANLRPAGARATPMQDRPRGGRPAGT